LGTLNPFRYRGYVYDEETGLYYLRSRYYNPVWGRFINADSVLGQTGQLLGHNIFVYCRNNSIVYSDTTGNTARAICAVYSGAVGVSALYSTGFGWDDAGNFAFIKTYTGTDGATGVGMWYATIGYSYQKYPNATLPDLIGASTIIGGSLGEVASFGGDVVQLERNFGTNVTDGSQTTFGVSIGLDFGHVENTSTYLAFTKYKGFSVPKSMKIWLSVYTIDQWRDEMDEYIKTIPVPPPGPTPAPGPAPFPTPTPYFR